MALHMQNVSAGEGSPPKVNTAAATHIFDKTRLCKFFAKGRCKRGQECTFAHSEVEILPQPDFFKTQLCLDFFRTGDCTSGERCSYAHSPEEIRHSRLPPKKKARVPALEHDDSQQLSKRRQPQRRRQHHSQKEVTAERESTRIKELEVRIQALQVKSDNDEVTTLNCGARGHFDKSGFGKRLASFSRQSTAEPSEPHCGFDRQASDASSCFSDDFDEDCGSYDAPEQEQVLQQDSPGMSGPCKVDRDEDKLHVEVVIERTFLTMRPLDAPASCRRSRSAPPSAHESILNA